MTLCKTEKYQSHTFYTALLPINNTFVHVLLSFEPCVVQVGESLKDAIVQLVERDRKDRKYQTTMYKLNDEVNHGGLVVA